VRPGVWFRYSDRDVFGRYHLPLWRKLLGLGLVVIFVWNFTILANQFISDNVTAGGRNHWDTPAHVR
jgi:hypothetical protein